MGTENTYIPERTAGLTGKAGQGPIVAIVSGGNIDLGKFCEIVAG